MIIFKQVTVVKGRASQLPRFEAPPKLGTGRRSQQHPASPMVDDKVMSPNQGIYQSDTPATHRGCMVVVSPPSKEQPWLQKEKASGKKQLWALCFSLPPVGSATMISSMQNHLRTSLGPATELTQPISRRNGHQSNFCISPSLKERYRYWDRMLEKNAHSWVRVMRIRL